jgi:hypothetical protein
MPLHPAVGYAMVALAATLFAINGTVSKVILGSGIDSAQLTEVRCAGALVGLMLIAFATCRASLWARFVPVQLSGAAVSLAGVSLALSSR